jgi:uncharacterized repeat protein (TIGR01451 family)
MTNLIRALINFLELKGAKTMNIPTGSQTRPKFTASLAILAMFLHATPALATIDNTATVTGTAPGGATINDAATENVDVVDDAPALLVSKSGAITNDVDGDNLADAGDTLTYTYVITNNGNVTVNDVSITDTEDAVGALAFVVPISVTTDNGAAAAGTLGDSTDTVTGDGDWDKLGPGDVITFTSTYTVQPGDITGAGAGDNELDNSAVANGTYNPGTGNITVSSAADTFVVPLDTQSGLTVTKVADDDTNVAAGQVITYTYTVTNTGNTPVTGVSLADTHNGVPGALTPSFVSFTTNTGSTNSGNTITLLQPGDVAQFTATYTVQQADVDNRQ